MNTHFSKSILAILFCLGILFSPLTLAAEYGGGKGTAGEPYEIWTHEQMNTIGLNPTDWGKHFKLMASIDMSAYTGTQYNIIGNSTIKFTGTFDGNEHRIRNLTYATTKAIDCMGLFGRIENATIKNLILINISLSSVSGNIGGMVGWNDSGSLSSCHVTGVIQGTGHIGGIVGRNNSGSLTTCSTTASVTGITIIGGLVGGNYSGSVINCYANSSVRATGNYIGGLVGYNSKGTLTSCYTAGSLDQTGSFVGGLAGWNSADAKATSCFWDTQTSGKTNGVGGGSSNGITGKTTVEMHDINTFLNAGWDFVEETINGSVDIWMMNGYPILSWHNTIGINGTTAISLAKGGQGQITFNVYNLSADAFNWTLTGYDSCGWITSALPVTGRSTNSMDVTTVTIDIDATSMATGNHTYPITILADNDDFRVIFITLSVFDPIDLESFSLLAKYWNMSECDSGQPCAQADWFVDGRIDILDLLQLAKSWLKEEIEIRIPSPIEDDFETGNFTHINWQQNGSLPWMIVLNSVYKGYYSARSGAITHGQISSMSFTADTTGLPTISFAYKVSSQSNSDYLRFFIDGVEQNKWSGNIDWSVAAFPLSNGIHTFEWRYTKDNVVSSGSDSAWLDEIVIGEGQPEGPISDHVFEIEMSLSSDFGEGYTSSVPEVYEFDAWMWVDDTVVAGTVKTPGGVIYEAEWDYDDDEIWLGVGVGASSLEDLADFTDGVYTFTVFYANGTSQSTSIPFALEDGNPIPPVDRVPMVTYQGKPLHNATGIPLNIYIDLALENPRPEWTYGIEWFPVDDNSEALSGEIEGLPCTHTTAGPLILSPNTQYEIELTVNHAIWSTNEDGIPYVVDKDSEVEIIFTTITEDTPDMNITIELLGIEPQSNEEYLASLRVLISDPEGELIGGSLKIAGPIDTDTFPLDQNFCQNLPGDGLCDLEDSSLTFDMDYFLHGEVAAWNLTFTVTNSISQTASETIVIPYP